MNILKKTWILLSTWDSIPELCSYSQDITNVIVVLYYASDINSNLLFLLHSSRLRIGNGIACYFWHPPYYILRTINLPSGRPFDVYVLLGRHFQNVFFLLKKKDPSHQISLPDYLQNVLLIKLWMILRFR